MIIIRIHCSTCIVPTVAVNKNNESEATTAEPTTSPVVTKTKTSTADQTTSSYSPVPTKLDQSSNSDTSMTQLVAKEHFVFTDPEGQLYHFSVEGNTIRDGTKV